MYEALGGGGGRTFSPEAEELFSKFHNTVHLQQHSGPDIFTVTHDQAFAEFLDGSKRLQSDFKGFFESYKYEPDSPYKPSSPEEVAGRIRKATQVMEMASDPDFPGDRTTVEAWLPTFERLEEDEEYRDEYFFYLRYRNAANISERYKLVKAVLLLNGAAGPVSILDAGCSLNNGLKRLAVYGEGNFPYDDTKVVQRVGKKNRRIHIEDHLGTAAFNHLVQEEKLELGQSVGLDLYDSDRDPLFRTWARSCSFYMSELVHKDRVAKFDELTATRPDTVSHRTQDITLDTFGGGEQFDAVIFSTMTYQLDKKGLKKVFENAKEVLKPEGLGLIISQDFVKFRKGRLRFHYPSWEWGWNYRTGVMNVNMPELGFQKYFTSENGRTKKLILEPALGELAVAKEIGLALASAA